MKIARLKPKFQIKSSCMKCILNKKYDIATLSFHINGNKQTY